MTRRMRAAGRVGRTVVLRLRFDDFSRATRSHTLPRADGRRPQTILAAARGLLAAATPMIERRGLTLSASRSRTSTTTARVSSRCRSSADADDALDAALDEVRERFGSTAVTRAVLLGRDPGLTVPLLPD